LVEQQQAVATLRARPYVTTPAPVAGERVAGPVLTAPAPPVVDSSEAEAGRRMLPADLAELQAALPTPARPEDRRVPLLRRRTVLAADASRLGVCRPASVRALLDAVDAFNVTPSLAGGAPVATLVREVVLDLDAANGAHATNGDARDESALVTAQERLEALEREAGAARSRALAVFAELESLRRASGGTERGSDAGGAFSNALRARLGRPMPTS